MACTKTLLIAEDNELMRRLLRSVVGDLAECITECGDGAQAVAVYAERQPEWVLMDIQMPVLDGLTATKRIRAAFPNARIVIVTEYSDDRWRAAAREAGACGYVLKENLLALRTLIVCDNPTRAV
jgi:CheY-like chemotaxis protein